MKKLIYSIALTIFIFSGLKATNNIDRATDPKESMKYAIKKSRPDLLKKALTNFELSENDKIWLLIYANEVAQIRKNKMNLNLIKPKSKITPFANYFFVSIGVFFIGGSITLSLLEEYLKKHSEISIIPTIITATTTVLAINKLISIGKEKNKEYFILHPYRNAQQKYLDSISILELIQIN